jgi:hypothetical protein
MPLGIELGRADTLGKEVGVVVGMTDKLGFMVGD